jgi:hypothetical protein
MTSSRGRITRVRGSMVIASLVSALLSAFAASAQPAEPAPAPAPRQPTAAELESWRKEILKTPRPNGCFTATYPERQWREVPCKTPPHKLYPPRPGVGIRVGIVGGGGPTDFSAVVTGHVSESEGSFDPGTVVSSECAVQCPNGVCPTNPTCTSAPADTYSLQLNTKPFTTQTCNTSPAPASCQGWEQFVYSSSGNGFIQYWLLNYGPAGTACPTPRGASCQQGQSFSDGWCPFSFTSGGPVYCVVNSVGGAPAPPEPATSLGQLKVTGAVAGVNGVANDSIAVTVSNGTPYTASGNNYFPDLGNQWQEAAFNVFGDGGGDEAVFNSGATIVVRTEVGSGTTSGPTCDRQSFTGESNNLTLVVPCCPRGGTSPAIVFTESNAAGATATCACAAVGERCVGSGDCCSGSCIDGTCRCLPLGSQCSGENVCCDAVDNECRNSVCARRIPPRLCNGVPTPRQPCTAPGNWHCCDDGWVCGVCR